MGHKVFIPVSDEIIFDRPDLINGPLRPYSENLACYHWMGICINPEDDEKIAESFNKRLRLKRSRGDSDYRHNVHHNVAA